MRVLKRLSLLIIPTILYIISLLIQLYIDPNHLLQTKLIIIGVTTLLLNILIILLPKNILSNPTIILILYLINLAFLIINFLIGPKIAGTKRWISLGHFTYQPSEMFKPILIILTTLLVTNDHLNPKRVLEFLAALAIPVLILIFMQPDAGTTIIIFSTLILIALKYMYTQNRDILRQVILVATLFVLYIATIFNKWFVTLLVVAVILFRRDIFKPLILFFNLLFISLIIGVIFYQHIPGLKQYQKKRIEVFSTLITTHPFNKALQNQEDLSFNLKQARIAIGSGGFKGKGLANITQSRLKFLPEYKTDFMYATLSETFGLFGIIIILSLYLTLIYILNKYTANNKIGNYLAFGTTSLILIELIINIGGNLGILPTKGIPLPFLGYGGTSLIAHSILISYTSHFNTS